VDACEGLKGCGARGGDWPDEGAVVVLTNGIIGR
jgi:hypothetical protein